VRHGSTIATLAGGYCNIHGCCNANGIHHSAYSFMKIILIGFFVGTLFGLGLAISQMVDPARVIGFLDVAGRWDATLLFVMAGALAVAVPGFALVLRRRAPLFAESFNLPTKTKIDPPLITGAIIFGIGWGLAGFCPGPALAALASASPAIFLFVTTILAGQWVASLSEGQQDDV